MADRIRVLHVDDDPGFADLTADFLERDGPFAVETAPSAAAALERLGVDAADGTGETGAGGSTGAGGASESDGTGGPAEAAAGDADGSPGFDCVVSDYDMRGTDGIEFLRAVREAYPDLPFVLFTGKGSEAVAADAVAAGVTDYLQKESGTSQYTVLANRIENAVEQYRAARRAAQLDRVRTLATRISGALLRADTRSELERAVCETLSDSDPYLFAWVGGLDDETGRIEPRTWAGVGSEYLDSITVTADESATGQGPGGRALREGQVAVAQDVRSDPSFEPWREQALERGYRAVAAVPLSDEDEQYGLLAVYADRSGAFDGAERELLAELGDNIGHAINSLRTREQLQAERERHAAMFENAPDPVAMVTYTGDGPVVQEVNAAFARVFGVESGAVAGEPLADLVALGGAHESDTIAESEADTGAVRAEVRRETEDGTRQFLVHAIPFGSAEAPADGAYVWYTEITERQEREARLRQQKAKIEALHDITTRIETAETAAAVYDAVVDAAESILAFDIAVADSVEEDVLVPRAVASDLDADQYYDEIPVDAEDNLAARAYRTGESSLVPDLLDCDAVPADTVFRSALTVPMGEYGVFQAVDETAEAFDETDRELTELLTAHARARLAQLDRERQLRARTDELERQNERLDRFASVVSHDLRNPLNVAQGRLELAREAHESDHLADVAAAHERMRDLIEDLLAMARDGDPVAETQPVRLGPFARECWDGVETGDATLAVETERAVEANQPRLRRLLSNLFRNAVEHGSTGSRTGSGDSVEHGSTGSQPEADDSVEHGSTGNQPKADDSVEHAGEDGLTVTVGDLADGFYVADDGAGIPPSERDAVFEPGYSGSDDGTGFGLDIVRRIAEAHGWSVAVAEGAAGGARFEFTGVEVPPEGTGGERAEPPS